MYNAKSQFLKYFFVVVIATVFGVIVGAAYQQSILDFQDSNFSSFSLQGQSKLDKILKIVKNNYVDSVNTDSLQELAIADILNSLDPHSVYLPPQAAENQNEMLEGNFDGIGIEYYVLNDTLFVTHVRPDGPSFKAGLWRGDKIIAVNGEVMNGNALLTNNIINKLRGKRGSKVEVSVIRKGLLSPKKFDIVRDRIMVSSIDAAFLIKEDIGFIKISKFGANTDEDFSEALDKLQQKGMKSLILDLRGNGGGYLSAATAIADQFLPDGKLIVYTQGLHEPRTEYKASADGTFEKGKLVVLIDEGTASASEIVTGALQDLDRATIVGRRSFGKGLVQEQFGFGDGSAMNLTIARYYTPAGRSIQKSYKGGFDAYRDEINHRYEHGDYLSLDSALNDSVFAYHEKVYRTSKGRPVFAGGGIMPDIFVPLDTANITPFFEKVAQNSCIPDFVYGKLINEPHLSQYKTAEDFAEHYHLSESDFQAFVKFCKTKGIKQLDYKEIKISKPLIRNEIEALLGRFYFEEEGFYRISNQQDDFVKKALKELRNPA
ncbi:MAG: S41 family peptidase [Sphingobacteriales bacterium]|nr:S41 family peptidase [Sphingobacteriales bacterium]